MAAYLMSRDAWSNYWRLREHHLVQTRYQLARSVTELDSLWWAHRKRGRNQLAQVQYS